MTSQTSQSQDATIPMSSAAMESAGAAKAQDNVLSTVFGFGNIAAMDIQHARKPMAVVVNQVKQSNALSTAFPNLAGRLQAKEDTWMSLFQSGSDDQMVSTKLLGNTLSLITGELMKVEKHEAQMQIHEAAIAETNERINSVIETANKFSQSMAALAQNGSKVQQTIEELHKGQQVLKEKMEKMETHPGISEEKFNNLTELIQKCVPGNQSQPVLLNSSMLAKIVQYSEVLKLIFTTDEVNGFSCTTVFEDMKDSLPEVESRQAQKCMSDAISAFQELFKISIKTPEQSELSRILDMESLPRSGTVLINFKVFASYLARTVENYKELLNLDITSDREGSYYTNTCTKVQEILIKLGGHLMKSLPKSVITEKADTILETTSAKRTSDPKAYAENTVMMPLWQVLALLRVLKAIDMAKTEEEFNTLIAKLNSTMTPEDKIVRHIVKPREDPFYSFGIPQEQFSIYSVANSDKYCEKPDEYNCVGYGLFWMGCVPEQMRQKSSGKVVCGVTDVKNEQFHEAGMIKTARDAKLRLLYGWSQEQIEAGCICGTVGVRRNQPMTEGQFYFPSLDDLDRLMTKAEEAKKEAIKAKSRAKASASKKRKVEEVEEVEEDDEDEEESEEEEEEPKAKRPKTGGKCPRKYSELVENAKKSKSVTGDPAEGSEEFVNEVLSQDVFTLEDLGIDAPIVADDAEDDE